MQNPDPPPQEAEPPRALDAEPDPPPQEAEPPREVDAEPEL